MPRATFSKLHSHLDTVLQTSEDVTAHGGAVIIDALARDFGLWERIRALPVLDHRTDTSRGFTPEVIVAQILLSLCTGGISIEDAGRLAGDSALGQLTGLPRMADASTLTLWLNRQSRESTDALWKIIRDFIAWVMARAPQTRLLHQGKLDVFFDDTQIEVHGRCFQGTAKNYEGDISYSWQTVWTGPFIAAARLDKGSVDPSTHLAFLLDDAKPLWEPYAVKGNAHFYADSGSSAGKYLNKLDRRGWEWSVSYNKWTAVLDRLAEGTPGHQWSPAVAAVGRTGEAIIEQHTWLRHQPGEDCERGHDFACVRWRAAEGGDLFWRYAYIVCGQAGGHPAPVHDPAAARRIFPGHHHKGALEHGFSALLSDLDLHHPPCLRFTANEMWYALGALAHNLLRAVQILHMEESQQSQRLRQIIRWWMTVPVKISRHAHRGSARYYVPRAALDWWRVMLEKVWPRRKRGRPAAPGRGRPPTRVSAAGRPVG
jgi:Transposase DDE domain group 1